MSLINYEILKEKLLLLNIEDEYINEMIVNSNYFRDKCNNDEIYYTFRLYTSFKNISKTLNIAGESLPEKLTPIVINFRFYKKFEIIDVNCVYEHDVNLYIITIDMSQKAGHSVKVDKIDDKLLENASISLNLLCSNFNIDKNIVEIIIKNKLINADYGNFKVYHFRGYFSIKTANKTTHCCDIPDNVNFLIENLLLEKKHIAISFDFDSNYFCHKVRFQHGIKTNANTGVYSVFNSINTDINGNIISYRKEVVDVHKKDPISGGFIFLENFEINLSGLPIEDIETYIQIYKSPAICRDILPEFFITGPCNIPNFKERYDLVKMITC